MSASRKEGNGLNIVVALGLRVPPFYITCGQKSENEDLLLMYDSYFSVQEVMAAAALRAVLP